MGIYTYLLLNLFAIFIPLIASFDQRLNFYKKWKYALPAIGIVAILFVLWDVYFTNLGIWGFNDKYITGVHLFNLPLEEILFFICIPYACLFTYDAMGILFKSDRKRLWINAFIWILIIALFSIGIIYRSKIYTSTTLLSLAILLLISLRKSLNKFMHRFIISYVLILLPFFIINGILTGSIIQDEVVWYNEASIIGIRMFTIPIEDVFYGMLLILSNVILYEKLKSRENLKSIRG